MANDPISGKCRTFDSLRSLLMNKAN
jgi:hypothetical protein